jgi:hypothetical protein
MGMQKAYRGALTVGVEAIHYEPRIRFNKIAVLFDTSAIRNRDHAVQVILDPARKLRSPQQSERDSFFQIGLEQMTAQCLPG